MSQEAVQISLEFTPNPNTLKFVINRQLLEKGAANFTSSSQAEKSPLATELFKIKGVQAVMLGTHFVTITKAVDGDWDVLADQVPTTIQKHLEAGLKAVSEDYASPTAAPENLSEVERKIRDVLDTEIRPAVAMDGGDITFGKYEDGIVYLHLQGSCSSCPSSVMTLKMGVESRLKEIVPEIKEVVQI